MIYSLGRILGFFTGFLALWCLSVFLLPFAIVVYAFVRLLRKDDLVDNVVHFDFQKKRFL